MTWQKAIVLNEGEQVLHSWDGNCERQHKAVVQKGTIFKHAETIKAKETHSGTLVLTNQRLLWFERRGFMSKAMRASFEIDLLKLQGIAVGGTVNKWVSITDMESESIFHLRGVGKKEFEPFRDMIYRQIDKLRASKPTTFTAPTVTKEVVTKEVVMIPCEYCKALMPQTSTFCPNCGARRKG
jgi:hypothetical protein